MWSTSQNRYIKNLSFSVNSPVGQSTHSILTTSSDLVDISWPHPISHAGCCFLEVYILDTRRSWIWKKQTDSLTEREFYQPCCSSHTLPLRVSHIRWRHRFLTQGSVGSDVSHFLVGESTLQMVRASSRIAEQHYKTSCGDVTYDD